MQLFFTFISFSGKKGLEIQTFSRIRASPLRRRPYSAGTHFPHKPATADGLRERMQAGLHDFNISCFRAENVLSLYCESREGGRNRPLFVPRSRFSGKTGPMTGFRKCHVGEITWLVGFPVPAYRENYKPCTPRRLCTKVKNVNVVPPAFAVFPVAKCRLRTPVCGKTRGECRV